MEPVQALAGVAYEVRGRAVDAVLYLHRLDDFRVDASDVQARRRFPCGGPPCKQAS